MLKKLTRYIELKLSFINRYYKLMLIAYFIIWITISIVRIIFMAKKLDDNWQDYWHTKAWPWLILMHIVYWMSTFIFTLSIMHKAEVFFIVFICPVFSGSVTAHCRLSADKMTFLHTSSDSSVAITTVMWHRWGGQSMYRWTIVENLDFSLA